MSGETIPPVTVEVAFDGGPLSTSYTWTDITPWVTGFGTKRGRSYEVDRIEAGSLELTLDNSDGRFTPMKNWSTELLPPNLTTGTDTLATTAGFTPGTGVTLSSSTSGPRTGTRALKFDGASSVGSWSSLTYTTTKSAVRPGNKYRAALYARNTVTAGYPALTLILRIFWYDADGNFIANTMTDSAQVTLPAGDNTYYLLESIGVAPPNAAFAQLHLQDPVAPGATWVMYTDDWSFAEQAPYYPNVVPRRRVRVRTANLLPKDTSTGGDVSQTSNSFQVSHVSGQTKTYVSGYAQEGAGSVRVDFVQAGDGVTAYNSSVRCGWVETISWGAWGPGSWINSRQVPHGLARVVAGKTYTASGYFRLGSTSATETVYARMRWYKDDGTFYNSSGSATITPVSGQYVYFSVTGVAGGGASSGVTLGGIEIGTKGSTAGVYGMVDCLQIEEGSSATVWTPGGSIFSGFVEKWPVSVNGLTSTVAVSAVDAFNVLGQTEFQRPMRQHILSTAPWGYYPLTEGTGADTVQNLANDQNPAVLTASKYGGATPAFGAPSVVPNDDGTCYSVTNIATGKGTVVDPTQGGTILPPTISTEFTVSFWCLPTRPSAGTYSCLFYATTIDGQKAVEVTLGSDGIIVFTVYFPDNTNNPGGAWHSSSSQIVLSSSDPSLVTLVIKNGEGVLWINDQWAGATSDTYGPAVATRIAQPRYFSLAGRLSPGSYYDFASGRFGHLAIWDRALNTEFEETYYIGADHASVFYNGVFYEDEAARITRLVKYAGFTGETVLDDPQSQILGLTWDDGQNALDEIQSTAEDASGYAFMDGDGRLVYHSRKRRMSGPTRYVLGETSGLSYESDLDLQVDEDRIVNEVSYSRPKGTSGVVRDTGSISTHGRKTKSIELRVTKDSEVKSAAYWSLNQYKDPVMRCDQVTLNASSCPALFPVVLGVEIGDRITLADLPSQTPFPSMDFYVEAIETKVSASGANPEWVTVLSLSPATVSDVWVLEDATFGLLDQTTELAW